MGPSGEVPGCVSLVNAYALGDELTAQFSKIERSAGAERVAGRIEAARRLTPRLRTGVSDNPALTSLGAGGGVSVSAEETRDPLSPG